MDQGSTPLHNVVPETEAATTTRVPAVAPAGYRRGTGVTIRDYATSMLFVVPYLLFFVAFTVAPLAYAFWVSLHVWTTVGGNTGFDGLAHYYNLFFRTDISVVQSYWDGMLNTVLFAVISVPLMVFVALVFALLLANGPFRNFFRAIYYVPAVLSVAVAMTIWLWIFQSGGMANTYIHRDLPWLIQQPYAWIAIFIATLWWTPGFNMVILLAGIMEVPNDYHEAAKIDGANVLQRIWYITLPILRPVLAFVIITQMIASFGLFGQPFLLTHSLSSATGGPNLSTQSVALSIYNEAFGIDQNLALAAAESFVLGIVLIILAVLQLRWFRATET